MMCKFSGLVAFPYDKLKCSLEVGGWAWSGSHQGIEPSSSGAAAFSNQEATAGASFTEYTIQKIDSEEVQSETFEKKGEGKAFKTEVKKQRAARRLRKEDIGSDLVDAAPAAAMLTPSTCTRSWCT